MPRTPEVCPTAFCPLSHSSRPSRSSNIAPRVLRILPPASCLLLMFFLVTNHSSLITVQAQSTTATLTGTIVDPNGAVVPDVNIAVISIAQGFQRLTKSDGEGKFIVAILPPGNYTVKAERQGFTTAEVRDVVLNVNDQVKILVQLKIGSIIGQTIDIVESTQLINESPAVGTVVDRQFVANLPLNGRSFNPLIALAPGVVQTKSASNDLGQFSINGQRANANYFTVDGVSANASINASANMGQTLGGSLPALAAQGGTNNLVSIDALEEFKVLTSSYAAEFGRTPGGQISIVTRSGSNDFHGTLFNYFRNDVFDANDWFANRAGQKRSALRQNDFGGVLGGPVLLPRFGEGGRQPGYDGRNQTFFFFSYEGLRLRQPQFIISEVPSISLRQSALPQIQPYLNAFPVPNGIELPNGLAPFSSGFSAPSKLNSTSIRVDHNVSEKLSVFGRYNHAPSQNVTRSVSFLSSPSSTLLSSKTLTVGAMHSINPRISNDLRFNYTKTKGQSFFSLDTFGGAVPVSDSQLFPPFANRGSSSVSFTLGFSLRPAFRTGASAENFQRQINLVDSFSIINGTHQLKLGVDYRRLSPIFGPQSYGLFATFNNATAVRNAIVSTLSTSQARAARPLFHNFSAFGQDTWNATRRTTLSYGVRWEVNPPPTGEDGDDAYTATGLDSPATITLAPLGTPLYQTTYNNFAPRFGIAYLLSQRARWETMVRGGIGIFYDLGTGQVAIGFANPPFVSDPLFKNTSNVPFPVTGTAAQPPPLASPPFTFVNAIDPQLKLPRSYQWNITLQQSLGSSQTVSAAYVAALGRRLINIERLINPNPRFAAVNIVRNEATSDYHALQLQLQRRLSRGFQALVSYTWSHSIDKVSSDFGRNLDRGSSDFDLRHAFAAAVTYDTPHRNLSPVADAILDNWSVDLIIRAQSATPVDIFARRLVNLGGQEINVRPDLIPGLPLYIDDPNAPGGRIFNNTLDSTRPGCKGPFCPPPTTRQGTLGRNVLRGFPLNQADVSIRRKFNLNERLNLLFRTDFFNILNHPNFGDPNNLTTAATFGQATTMFGRSLGTGGVGGGFNPLYQIGGPRSMQFSLKIQF
ncbi:MAG: carboxypeptidase regulatory-like domain-containing protein [Pyrinomonadaceae bacterium]